eukprot:scaffold111098_cov19-Tisochrysis_lutea.AAC.1
MGDCSCGCGRGWACCRPWGVCEEEVRRAIGGSEEECEGCGWVREGLRSWARPCSLLGTWLEGKPDNMKEEERPPPTCKGSKVCVCVLAL